MGEGVFFVDRRRERDFAGRTLGTAGAIIVVCVTLRASKGSANDVRPIGRNINCGGQQRHKNAICISDSPAQAYVP